MNLNDEKITFPIVGKMSFFKVKEALEENLKSKDASIVQHASSLLKEMAKVPDLIDGTEDFKIVEKHPELVEKMLRLLFPPALTMNEIKGATPPFDFSFFHVSKRLENILNAAGPDFDLEVKGMDPDLLYMMGCTTILQAYYHFPVNLSIPLIFDIPEASGEMRYYRSAFNADLMEIIPTENAVELTEEDGWELMDNFHDLDLWKQKFPPNSWHIKGIGLMTLMDITVDQTINMMTSNLLAGRGSFDKVMDNIRSLLRIDEVSISFIRSQYNTLFSMRIYDDSNVLLHGKEELTFEDGFSDGMKKSFFEEHQAFIVPNVEHYVKENQDLLSEQLLKKELGSYLITPLEYNDEVLGFIELGSPNKRQINSIVEEKLKLALPLLSMAASRFKQEGLNRIEAVIQEEFTSIHPSVKWRFEKAAQKYIDGIDVGEKVELTDLIFNEVYPLYGQMDIRSSSVLRNDAVIADLSAQLKSVKKVLKHAIEEEPLPAYEEMVFRVDSYLSEFKNGLVEGSEQRVLSFLKSDIYPIFDHLQQINSSIKKEVKTYKALLNPDTHMIYDRRRAFDESVNRVNGLLAEIVDEKQKTAQKMFPHYFERYKTDGLEYNIYIGQSISETRKFNSIYLRNLQIWQLNTLCEMEHELHRLRKELPMPLEVASLLLVHNASLSINFRIDEKRFDVEGAYNARYEIIKKRVDKAHIKGTNERITSPGKIVIVYTNKEDAAAYLQHIKYLETKAYVLPNTIEDLELEDLQGVTGLKALRVTVDYSLAEKNLNIDELIQGIEAK